jgi:hypothetical protein
MAREPGAGVVPDLTIAACGKGVATLRAEVSQAVWDNAMASPISEQQIDEMRT